MRSPRLRILSLTYSRRHIVERSHHLSDPEHCVYSWIDLRLSIGYIDDNMLFHRVLNHVESLGQLAVGQSAGV